MNQQNNAYTILNIALPSESHDSEQLREAISKAEALGYMVAVNIKNISDQIADVEKQITVEHTRALLAQGRDVKVAQAAAAADLAVKDLVHQKMLLESQLKYEKHVQHLVENRCSVGQSFLSNTTSQIKAGINLPEVRQ